MIRFMKGRRKKSWGRKYDKMEMTVESRWRIHEGSLYSLHLGLFGNFYNNSFLNEGMNALFSFEKQWSSPIPLFSEKQTKNPEGRSDLPKIRQQLSGRAGTQVQVSWFAGSRLLPLAQSGQRQSQVFHTVSLGGRTLPSELQFSRGGWGWEKGNDVYSKNVSSSGNYGILAGQFWNISEHCFIFQKENTTTYLQVLMSSKTNSALNCAWC